MRTLFEAIGPVAEEVEEAKVAEDLELLADFGADISAPAQAFIDCRPNVSCSS